MKLILTTKGELPADQVELRRSIVSENDETRLTRVDKHLVSTGEWVGNDMVLDIKRGQEILGAQESRFIHPHAILNVI